MCDYAASAAAALPGEAEGGQQVITFPEERLNSFMYEGLLPSTAVPAAAAAEAVLPQLPLPAGVLQHPLEKQQQQLLYQRERQQLQRAGALYGLHMPLRMKTERELCAMTQRLPGLPSSMWGLQIVMGLDDEVSVEDYMGRERPAEEEDCPASLGIHERIERFMGI